MYDAFLYISTAHRLGHGVSIGHNLRGFHAATDHYLFVERIYVPDLCLARARVDYGLVFIRICVKSLVGTYQKFVGDAIHVVGHADVWFAGVWHQQRVGETGMYDGYAVVHHDPDISGRILHQPKHRVVAESVVEVVVPFKAAVGRNGINAVADSADGYRAVAHTASTVYCVLFQFVVDRSDDRFYRPAFGVQAENAFLFSANHGRSVAAVEHGDNVRILIIGTRCHFGKLHAVDFV